MGGIFKLRPTLPKYMVAYDRHVMSQNMRSLAKKSN